jgi:hypothetical protein
MQSRGGYRDEFPKQRVTLAGPRRDRDLGTTKAGAAHTRGQAGSAHRTSAQCFLPNNGTCLRRAEERSIDADIGLPSRMEPATSANK